MSETGRRNWKPSLRLTISTIMCALVAGMAVLVFTLLYSGARKSLLAFSDSLMREVASTARAQVRGFLNVGRIAIEQAGGLAQNRVLDPGDVETFEAFSRAFLETQLTVNALYYGDQNGNMTMVQRRPDGSFSTKTVRRTRANPESPWIVKTTWRHRDPGASLNTFRVVDDPDDRYDPRERPWYRHWSEMSPQEPPASWPRQDRGPGPAFWTDVYVFHSTREPGATASLPYMDGDGKFRGVIGVDLALADLSRFLSTVQIGRRGMAFIMDGRRRLIAVPDFDRLLYDAEQAESGAEPELRTIERCSYPELRALSSDPVFDGRVTGREDGGFAFQHGRKRYLATLAAVAPESGSDWMIGVVAPEDDFLGDIKRTRAVTAACIAGAMILGFILAALVSHVVSRHLMKLVQESSRIRDLEISPSRDPGSAFKEIHDVLSAFEGMKTGLRSFEKYVPSKLVRRLLARDVEAAYGGAARELTVLFSDIRDFTPLCETSDPGFVARKLGAYFSAITDAVQDDQSQGVVDKFIGDSVMAFWGAPEDVDGHSRKACLAALSALAAIEDLRLADPDFHDLHTRIGIHTCTALVGNFGSNERLNYTCIGDGVNLASRLEATNKLYGTRVIISEQTRSRIGDDFETRKLDLVAVKGKTQGVEIYELLGRKGAVPDDRLTAARLYEQALDAYLDRRWNEAAETFSRALDARPDDLAAGMMIQRCRRYAENPPAPDWDGVCTLDSK